MAEPSQEIERELESFYRKYIDRFNTEPPERFLHARLWEERRLVSVANLTRQDGREYLPLAARAGVRPQVVTYPLAHANRALDDLRSGAFTGAAVLTP